MDGNGRWAEKRGLPRLAGHSAGTDNVRRVIKCFNDYDVKYITIYAFSTENWSRPQREVREGRGLAGLLRPRWAEDIVGELRKVTWPSREDTWYLTFVVLVVATAFGIFLGGVDMFFNWAIDNTLLR